MLAWRTYGREPDKLIFPFSLNNTESLWANSISFQEMAAGFTGTSGNHLSKSKNLAELPILPVKIQAHAVQYSSPIPHATLAF